MEPQQTLTGGRFNLSWKVCTIPNHVRIPTTGTQRLWCAVDAEIFRELGATLSGPVTIRNRKMHGLFVPERSDGLAGYVIAAFVCSDDVNRLLREHGGAQGPMVDGAGERRA